MKRNHRFSLAAGVATLLVSSLAVAEDIESKRHPVPEGVNLPSLQIGNFGDGALLLTVSDTGVGYDASCGTGSFSLPSTGLQLQLDPNDSSIEYITFTGTTRSRIWAPGVPGVATTITLWATIPSGQTVGGVNEPTVWTYVEGDSTTAGDTGTALTLGGSGPRILCGG